MGPYGPFENLHLGVNDAGEPVVVSEKFYISGADMTLQEIADAKSQGLLKNATGSHPTFNRVTWPS